MPTSTTSTNDLPTEKAGASETVGEDIILSGWNNVKGSFTTPLSKKEAKRGKSKNDQKTYMLIFNPKYGFLNYVLELIFYWTTKIM